ncbi:MAG: hypothetical protein AB8E15_12725 [Bdellovibrionales bacterium]
MIFTVSLLSIQSNAKVKSFQSSSGVIYVDGKAYSQGFFGYDLRGAFGSNNISNELAAGARTNMLIGTALNWGSLAFYLSYALGDVTDSQRSDASLVFLGGIVGSVLLLQSASKKLRRAMNLHNGVDNQFAKGSSTILFSPKLFQASSNSKKLDAVGMQLTYTF